MKALFDGGIVGQSIIYKRALDLAEKAEHITFVSQYCPSGKLAEYLKKKNAAVYYNRPLQADGLNRFAIRFNQFFTGIKTLYTRPRYLHAKFMIFTMKNGTKVAITGSHNFAYTGVLLGTREIALETKDPEVIEQLEAFIAKEIA